MKLFRKPFSFNGRIRRTEYGLSFIIYLIFAIIIDAIVEGGKDTAAEIIGLAFIPLAWLLLAQGSKRCHDIGYSGWWQLLPLYVVWLLLSKGQSGSNKYGEDPKQDKKVDEINLQQTE